MAADWTVALHYDDAGGLTLGQDGVAGGTSIPLSYDPAGLSADVRAQFPHLATLPAFHLPADQPRRGAGRPRR